MREMLSTLKPKDKVTIVASMSGLALVLMSIILLLTFCSANNHQHEYDYRLEREDGKFNLVGYCQVPGCADPEYVEKDVSGVKMVYAERPTCISEGKREYIYYKNGGRIQYVETIETCAHVFNPNDLKLQDGRITATCSQAGCGYVLKLENVTSLAIDQYISGNCFMPVQTVYKYEANGRESNFIALAVETEAHTLGGKPATSLENADGSYNFNENGVHLLSSSNSLACGETGDGYYVCEKCAQRVVVKVKKPQHNIVFSTSGIVEPTPYATGSVNVTCSSEGCQYSDKIVLPTVVVGVNAEIVNAASATSIMVRYTYTHALGQTLTLEFEVEVVEHNYEYKLTLIPITDNSDKKYRFDLVGTCTDPYCIYPNNTIENVDFEMTDTSTCVKGETTFSCEMDGHVYTLKLPWSDESISDKHDYDYNLTQATKPTKTSAGSIILYCKACNYSETVELPKVELGVNAEVVLDEEYGTTLKYTYTTDKGCVITMLIVVDK